MKKTDLYKIEYNIPTRDYYKDKLLELIKGVNKFEILVYWNQNECFACWEVAIMIKDGTNNKLINLSTYDDT